MVTVVTVASALLVIWNSNLRPVFGGWIADT